jgi:UDP-N-acetylmuramoyl-L-alanyl-D-glutamate--2,6-diaminopimelate ligase
MFLETIKDIRTGNEHVITLVWFVAAIEIQQKRPVMAAIACEYSDKVILTSDNPRSEDPEEIFKSNAKKEYLQFDTKKNNANYR